MDFEAINQKEFFWLLFFIYVGPPKENIFSGHHLSPAFQSSLHITEGRKIADAVFEKLLTTNL